ncbi:MAG TPA: hypothetical protein VFV58_30705 [Blastocatellia bacterium]|jgi:hypothetical protein|nr:hypothetical protein [Blastocatellia bacterium]
MILCEMLGGRRAFNGASVADVMSAILKEEYGKPKQSILKLQ